MSRTLLHVRRYRRARGTPLDHMDFGTLQIATLWRLEKDGVIRQAVVVDSPQGPRLVIVEADQIISWEKFVLAGELRKRAVELRKEHTKTGWLPVVG